jgi:hypothetical protein
MNVTEIFVLSYLEYDWSEGEHRMGYFLVPSSVLLLGWSWRFVRRRGRFPEHCDPQYDERNLEGSDIHAGQWTLGQRSSKRRCSLLVVSISTTSTPILPERELESSPGM